MESGQKNIDQLFKDSLSNFEADVNPSVWKNIEQGLKTSPVQESIRPNRMFSRMKLKNVISFLVLSGAVIFGILYFTGKKTESPAPVNLNVPSEEATQPKHVDVQKTIPPGEQVSQLKDENIPVKENQQRSRENEKIVGAKAVNTETNLSKENESIVPSTPASPAVKNSKESGIHLEKNPAVKNNSESTENPVTSKNAESSQDANTASPSDELNNGQLNGNPVFDTDNGFAFYPPDAFSPNGDGLNDYYTPMGHNFKDYEIIIYDQLSTEVFSSKDISISWDGRLRDGKVAPSGIYFYVIKVKELTNKSHLYKGRLTLKQ